MGDRVSDDTARVLRRAWFDFLDTVAPARPKLHAYCLKLTGSVFDAEDLVQETLLRGFGAIGRGDLHGRPDALVQNVRAYLCRIATNLWIDAQRRRSREARGAALEPAAETREPSLITPAAGAALFELMAPQERAAVVLKDVFDFSLEDIASILSTSVGAVKSALRRARGKLEAARGAGLGLRGTPASRALIDRFVAAFNAKDIAAVTAILSETVIYEARGVGGEIGKGAIWIDVNTSRPEGVTCERATFEGEEIVIGVFTRADGRRTLLGASRLEEADGVVSRHVGYFYTPETLALIGEALGLRAANHGYHQEPAVLEGMIADSSLAWRGD